MAQNPSLHRCLKRPKKSILSLQRLSPSQDFNMSPANNSPRIDFLMKFTTHLIYASKRDSTENPLLSFPQQSKEKEDILEKDVFPVNSSPKEKTSEDISLHIAHSEDSSLPLPISTNEE